MTVASDSPYDFYVTTKSGVGILSVFVPAPLRAVRPITTHLEVLFMEEDETVDISPEIEQAVNTYVSFLKTVDGPLLDEALAWQDGMVVANIQRILNDIVCPLQLISVPVIPDTYVTDHIVVSDTRMLVTGTERFVWSSKTDNIHCRSDAVPGAICGVFVDTGKILTDYTVCFASHKRLLLDFWVNVMVIWCICLHVHASQVRYLLHRMP